MKDTKTILIELRESRGLSMRDVAEGADIPYSTYSKYEYGSRDLGTPAIRKLASFYGVSADVIIGLEPIPDPDDEEVAQLSLGKFLEVYHNFPVDSRLKIIEKMFELIKAQELKLQRKQITEEEYKEAVQTILVQYYPYPVSAGVGEDLLTDPEKPYDREFVRTREAEKASFAVRVSGDSMEPTFFNDDIVFVTKAQRVDIGEIGVFQMDNEGYIKEWGDMELISHNPKYPPIPATSEVVCRGKVIGKAELPPDTET